MITAYVVRARKYHYLICTIGGRTHLIKRGLSFGSLACFQMKAAKAVSVLLLALVCCDDYGTAGVDAESSTTTATGTQSQNQNYNGFPLQTRVVVDRNYTNPSWTGYGWATLSKHSCQHNAVVGGTTYSSSDAAEAACEKTDGCMAVYVSVQAPFPPHPNPNKV